MKIFERFTKPVAVDLGTSNTRVYLKGRGVVVTEPTIIAVNAKSGQILTIGNEARKMLDRTPQHIRVVKPVQGGVVSDFEMSEEIMRHHLRELDESIVRRYGLAVLGIPSDLTEVERKSAEDVLLSAGASRVYLVESAIAAAIGARLPVAEPTASMVVNLGGGTTEIAVVSVGGAVASKSLKVAGDRMNEDIVKFVREEFKLAIGEPTAEEIKVSVGSAVPMDEKMEIVIRGRDLGTGLPREVTVKNPQVRLAISRSLKTIADAARSLIESSPPELVGDILERGIFVCGGGSLLRGFDRYMEKEISVKTTLIEDPMSATIRGLATIVDQYPVYEKLLESQVRSRDIKM